MPGVAEEMRVKNANPSNLIANKDVSKVVRLYFEINHLKQLFRQGWLTRGRDVPEAYCESVADHVFASAMLAMLLCDTYYRRADKARVVMMIIIHELGEIRYGDRLARTNVEKDEKFEAERAAIMDLLRSVPNGHEYLELWMEFERGTSIDAKLAREVDKLEMAFQAKIYSMQHGKDLREFLAHVRGHLVSDAAVALLDELEAL